MVNDNDQGASLQPGGLCVSGGFGPDDLGPVGSQHGYLQGAAGSHEGHGVRQRTSYGPGPIVSVPSLHRPGTRAGPARAP